MALMSNLVSFSPNVATQDLLAVMDIITLKTELSKQKGSNLIENIPF
jgi:hypothetical protein